MSKTFIFAFDTYYPVGGVTGLKAVLDFETNQHIGSDMLILPEELAKLAIVESRDHYQVLHFAADGAPLLVEHWERHMPPVVNQKAEKQYTLPDGDVLLLKSVVSEGFPGEV